MLRPPRPHAVPLLTVLALGLATPSARAQYFGQSKVQYKTFHYQNLKTEHFDIYFYPEEEQAVEEAGRMAERWPSRLSKLLGHDLRGRQPIILYACSPDFEQTNAIGGRSGKARAASPSPSSGASCCPSRARSPRPITCSAMSWCTPSSTT